SQALASDPQRHEQDQKRVKEMEDLGGNSLFTFGSFDREIRRLGLLPCGGERKRNQQHRTPEQVEPLSGLEAAAGAVVVHGIDAAGEEQKHSKATKERAGHLMAGEEGGQNKGAGHKSVTDEV